MRLPILLPIVPALCAAALLTGNPSAHAAETPSAVLVRPYSGAKIDVTTYHYDNNRTGWNAAEQDLTVASVASADFGLRASLTVDGTVLGQPLLVSDFSMPDGSVRDVLIVATMHNTVYAFDAQTYAQLWQVNFGPSQSTGAVHCGNVRPEYGIASTPVIVRQSANSASLYLVTATNPGTNTFVSTLHKLNLGTGADLDTPAVISPSATMSDGSIIAYNPRNQWNRPGLAFNNHSVYVAIGSHCDAKPNSITGWLLRYDNHLKPLAAFHTVDTPGGLELASIWMSGFAPAIDPSGFVFVATGNGDFEKGRYDWGESVLKLTPTLSSVNTYFTPSNYANMNTNDSDLGSGGVMLLPPVPGQLAPHMAVAMGKTGTLYLLKRSHLGGLTADDSGPLQAQWAGGGGLWGGPAYYNGPSGPTVFTQTTKHTLRAWALDTGAKPSLTATVKGTSLAGGGGSIPIVSSNGATPGTGVVWLINRAAEPFTIEAYDAEHLGAPIFTAPIGLWSNLAENNPYLTPMQANGRVYAAGDKVVQVFGLAP